MKTQQQFFKRVIGLARAILAISALSAPVFAGAATYSMIIPAPGVGTPPPPGQSASTAGVMSNYISAIRMVVSDPVTNQSYDPRLGENSAGTYQPINGEWVPGFPIYEQLGTGSSVIVTYPALTRVNQIVFTGTRGAMNSSSALIGEYQYSRQLNIEADYGDGTFVMLAKNFQQVYTGFSIFRLGAAVKRLRITDTTIYIDTTSGYLTYYQPS